MKNLCLAAIAALALTACSSGGSVPPVAAATDPSGSSNGTRTAGIVATSAIQGVDLPSAIAQSSIFFNTGSSGMSISINGTPLAQTSPTSRLSIPKGANLTVSVNDTNGSGATFPAINGAVWPVNLGLGATGGGVGCMFMGFGTAGFPTSTFLEIPQLFTNAGNLCTYPQTEDVMFIDPKGNWTTLYLQAS